MPKSFSFPFEFTATEEQARTWIASMRSAMMTRVDDRNLVAASG
jgi:hypothetical protein